ncbi:MAG: zinc-binding dehydrogenase [Bacteroidota bacterium]
MKAYLLDKSGKSDVLRIHNVPQPEIVLDDDVLIRVLAIGLNYAEVLSRKGQYSWAPPRPYIPGMECYGEVVAVGKAVEHLSIGDRVMAGGQYGSYAEYKLAPQHLVFKAIEGFTPEENAAFLVNFMTAWVAIEKQARIAEGEICLIHAAAGGVGTAAIQIAKARGGRVIGTAGSASKLEVVKNLGAERAINYLQDDFYTAVKESYGGVDVVLEVVGGDVFRKSLELLNPFGRICIAGYASIPLNKWNPLTYWKTWKDAPKINIMKMAKASHGVFATHIGYLTDNKTLSRKIVGEVRSFCDKNGLKPVVGAEYSFDQIADAHSFMQSRKSHGKIVIKLD